MAQSFFPIMVPHIPVPNILVPPITAVWAGIGNGWCLIYRPKRPLYEAPVFEAPVVSPITAVLAVI